MRNNSEQSVQQILICEETACKKDCLEQVKWKVFNERRGVVPLLLSWLKKTLDRDMQRDTMAIALVFIVHGSAIQRYGSGYHLDSSQ